MLDERTTVTPRITTDPDLMAGVPTIRGPRIPVATVVSMVADGMTADEIWTDLPDPTPPTSPRLSATQPRPSANDTFRCAPREAATRQQSLARLVEILTQEGWDVVHVSALGLRPATDKVVLAAARDDDRVLVSADTDFGALLAHHA